MASFFDRLKERKLVQWALAYAAGAWVLLEATGFVSDRFAWPEVIVRALTLLAGVGFLVTLVLAWYHGEKGRQRVSGPELLMLTALLVVAGVALSVIGPPAVQEQGAEEGDALPLVSMDDSRPSIAVLPLDNIGDLDESAAFTDGIHDDILTHLYKIGDLKVISRTSVLEYRDPSRNLRQIADELGVATILEGGVQRSGNRVRINVQLIDAETDEHLWAETYDEDLTAENVFAIQTDIARRIASALKARLTPDQDTRIAARPTDNLEAYEHYLRGNAYYRRGQASMFGRVEQRTLWDSATVEYERAVELDPAFSAAWAALATVRTRNFYTFPGRRTAEQREKGEQALERAVELAPESFETHMAQAFYYRTAGEDLPRAMRHLTSAETLRPNDSEALSGIDAVLRFQGKWEEALRYSERALELDPQNASLVRSVAGVSLHLRRFAEAERYLDRAIAMDPSADAAYGQKFSLYLWGLGDTVKARVFGEQHPDRNLWLWQSRLHYLRRDYEGALEILRSQGMEGSGHAYLPLYLAGRSEEIRASGAENARWRRQALETSGESWTAVQVAVIRGGVARGLAFAGDMEAAVREAEEALELYPVASDQVNYWRLIQSVCHVYILAGDHEAAIDQLEVLRFTAAQLRLDPFYDPLRDHPRFQALLEKYGSEH